MANRTLQVITGNANRPLAEDVVRWLNERVTWGHRPPREFKLCEGTVQRFADGEIDVTIRDQVREDDVYIVQPTCGTSQQSVNDSLMEVVLMADTLRRASAGIITAVLPYFGYGRAERKAAPRKPISAKVAVDMLVCAGVNRFVFLDLHAAQIQAFTNLPSDHMSAMPALLPSLEPWRGCAVVSPDIGGVSRAHSYAKRLGAKLIIIHKQRERANVSEVLNVIGDPRNEDCVILDDMFDTCGTVVNAANVLAGMGAKSVAACGTHGLFSGPAPERIMSCAALSQVIVADSIPLSDAMLATGTSKVKRVSLGPLLAAVIARTHTGGSVSDLFG